MKKSDENQSKKENKTNYDCMSVLKGICVVCPGAWELVFNFGI